MPGYKTARADFEWCENLCELEDQVDLDAEREALMRNPTKAQAGELYCQGVALWLQHHADYFVGKENVAHINRLRKRYADYL
jgi:hypothetical protein